MVSPLKLKFLNTAYFGRNSKSPSNRHTTPSELEKNISKQAGVESAILAPLGLYAKLGLLPDRMP